MAAKIVSCKRVTAKTKRFPRRFFQQNALTLAPRLLGCVLECRDLDGLVTSGIITEVEAYLGADDPASHAFGGPTPRAKIMFERGGVAYVYFSYGNHHCVNVVAGPQGQAGAVLIRALEPLKGVERMQRRRRTKDIGALCSGPGKLTQALGITREHNGLWLAGRSPLRLRPWLSGKPAQAGSIKRGPRIGISKAKTRPWRFWLKA